MRQNRYRQQASLALSRRNRVQERSLSRTDRSKVRNLEKQRVHVARPIRGARRLGSSVTFCRSEPAKQSPVSVD